MKIVKTGPSTGTVGVAFNYTLTATNTGLVEAPNTTITDVFPAGSTFNSATSPCTYTAGYPDRVLQPRHAGSRGGTGRHINVTPTTAGTISNTATITPNDATPGDNTSTWVIGNIQAAAEVVVQPTFTG